MNDERTTQMEESKKEQSPVLQIAKERKNGNDKIVTLSTGYRAKINVVAATLIDDVVSLVKAPSVPMWHNEDKDRDEPNPSDPEYIKALAETDHRRNTVAMDTMVMFGIDLVDGVPQDTKWISKLKMMVKRGMLDLTNYDLDDEEDKEFLFKRYIAVGIDDLNMISSASGISGEDVKRAEESFRGN